MDSEKVYKWNKPCQTDYFNQTLHSNDTRYEVKTVNSLMGWNGIQAESPHSTLFSSNRQFCYYGYVFDPIRNHCVRLKETECSREYLRHFIWQRFEKLVSESVNDVGNGWNLNQHPPISSAFIEFSSDWQRISAIITGLMRYNVNLYPPQLNQLIRQRIQQRIQQRNGGNDLYRRSVHCIQFYLRKDEYPAHIWLFVRLHSPLEPVLSSSPSDSS